MHSARARFLLAYTSKGGRACSSSPRERPVSPPASSASSPPKRVALSPPDLPVATLTKLDSSLDAPRILSPTESSPRLPRPARGVAGAPRSCARPAAPRKTRLSRSEEPLVTITTHTPSPVSTQPRRPETEPIRPSASHPRQRAARPLTLIDRAALTIGVALVVWSRRPRAAAPTRRPSSTRALRLAAVLASGQSARYEYHALAQSAPPR